MLVLSITLRRVVFGVVEDDEDCALFDGVEFDVVFGDDLGDVDGPTSGCGVLLGSSMFGVPSIVRL